MALVILATSLTGCESCAGAMICDTEVQREAPSPSGELVAVVYHRECGATTPFNTQVGLTARGEGLDLDGGQVLAVAGKHDLVPEWRDEKTLTIRMPRGEVFRKQTAWNGVTIEYVE